jgi:hypothetical protein
MTVKDSLPEEKREIALKHKATASVAIRAAATDYTGADPKAFAEALVNYEQPWEDELELTVATGTGAA